MDELTPQKKKFYQKKGVVLVLVVAFIVIGFFVFKDWDTVLNNEFDVMVTITGNFSCLPLKADSKKDPNDCNLGVRDRGGLHYGLDVSLIQDANTDLKSEDTIAVTGSVRPASSMDAEEWRDYDIDGVILVNTLLRTR